MHQIGSHILEKLLNSDGGDYNGRNIPCERGHNYEFVEYRAKKLLTVLGPVEVKRAYYHDKECKNGFCSKDKDLDIEGTSFSPGVRRMMSRAGTYKPFSFGQEDIKELAGLHVATKEIERQSNQSGQQVEKYFEKEAITALSNKVIPMKKVPIIYICMDGTGIPVVKSETVNRKGKGEGGTSKTREVKLGCVFTQTSVDEKGHPVRDEMSTSYVGAIETAEEFSSRIYAESIRRGAQRAEKVCVIGDGAPWIWNIADEQFYGAIQIIDLYHAREHYWNVAKVAFGNDKERKQWAHKRRKELDQGKVEKVIKAICELPASFQEENELFEKEANYFDKNKNRMRYNEFRKEGFFVGSGVLEAGCRTVIGQRLKQSGMHWTVNGANNIIALRCCFFSNRWEDFWEYRACG